MKRTWRANIRFMEVSMMSIHFNFRKKDVSDFISFPWGICGVENLFEQKAIVFYKRTCMWLLCLLFTTILKGFSRASHYFAWSAFLYDYFTINRYDHTHSHSIGYFEYQYKISSEANIFDLFMVLFGTYLRITDKPYGSWWLCLSELAATRYHANPM